jgi:hypothetical protein
MLLQGFTKRKANSYWARVVGYGLVWHYVPVVGTLMMMMADDDYTAYAHQNSKEMSLSIVIMKYIRFTF